MCVFFIPVKDKATASQQAVLVLGHNPNATTTNTNAELSDVRRYAAQDSSVA